MLQARTCAQRSWAPRSVVMSPVTHQLGTGGRQPAAPGGSGWGPRLLGPAAFIAGRARAPQRALTKGGRVLQNVFVLSLNSQA